MTNVVAKEHLEQYVQRLERLDQEKQDISDSIKDVLAEAKSNGFDIKTLKQVLKLRKIDRNELAEQEMLLEMYRDALGV